MVMLLVQFFSYMNQLLYFVLGVGISTHVYKFLDIKNYKVLKL